MTLQGHQYDLERQWEGGKGVGWALMSITCLIQTFVKATYKVPDCPI